MKDNIFIKAFEHIEEVLLSISFTTMTIICFVQVITRYIFHYSMPWSEEVLRGLFVWSSCLGISLGFRTRSHMGVDAIVSLFPVKFRKILSIISYIVTIAFCLVVIYFSFGVTMHQFSTNQKTIALGMPIAYVSVSLIIGFLLAIIRIIQVLSEDIRSKNNVDEVHISEGLL